MTPKFKKIEVLGIDGKTHEISVQDPIPYPIFKSVRSLLKEHPEKAILILNNSVVKEAERQVMIDVIESESTPHILRLEDIFADLIYTVSDDIKKK